MLHHHGHMAPILNKGPSPFPHLASQKAWVSWPPFRPKDNSLCHAIASEPQVQIQTSGRQQFSWQVGEPSKKTVCEETPICARQREEIGRQMWGTVGEPFQRAKATSLRKQTCHFAPGFSIPSHLAADFGQHLFPADLGAYIRDAVTVAARLR